MRTEIVVHPANQQEKNILEAFMHALKIKFEIYKGGGYKPEFIEKIIKSQKQAKNGDVIEVKKEDLKTYLGL